MFETRLPSLVKQVQKPSSADPETVLQVQTGVILHLPTNQNLDDDCSLVLHSWPCFLFALKLGLLSQAERASEAESVEQEAKTRSVECR